MADFIFDIYRLNIVDDESLMGFMGAPIRRNEEIALVIKEATNASYDVVRENPTSIHKWSLREFFAVDEERLPLSQVIGVTLARSVLEKQGPIVTDTGIEQGVSEAEPPLALFSQLLFQMSRHLVAVEYNSNLMTSSTWRDVLHEMLANAANNLQLRSGLRLMPMPSVEEVISAFRSFDRLTRLRTKLLLPNPELTRYTKKLFDELKGGNIRELLVDMRNPSGLSTSETELPFAAASIAAAGYKDSEVTFEGVRPGSDHKQIVKTGEQPLRGEVEELRDFVRGISATIQTKEARGAIRAILAEIDRLAEPPTPS